MKLSIIIPIGDMAGGVGLDERVKSLVFAIRTFYSQHKDTETIIVSQGVHVPWISEIHSNIRTIEVNYPIFNKSWLVNVGVRQAKADVVCIAEADMWAYSPYLTKVVDWMKRFKMGWCFAWNRLHYTSPEEKAMILETETQPIERPSRIVRPTKGYSEGGLIMFTKRFYQNMGGFNEWMEELGGIDNEVCRRAEYLSSGRNRYPMFPEIVYHLWHEKVRRKESESRKRNVGIYRYVCRSLPQSITLLRSKDWGNVIAPYSSGDSFCMSRTKAGF